MVLRSLHTKRECTISHFIDDTLEVALAVTRAREGPERISEQSDDGSRQSAGDRTTAGSAIGIGHKDSGIVTELLEGLVNTIIDHGHFCAPKEGDACSVCIMPVSGKVREKQRTVLLLLVSGGHCSKWG
ncbi:hypothetical protein TRVL_08697 [Trypanosoma vivax]|nr:hypothetical protein TRVL_08697 [Trypanosoma vivax]